MEGQETLGRICCPCIFSDGAKTWEECAEKLEATLKTNDQRKALKTLSSALDILKEQHAEHVTGHMAQFRRGMIDAAKARAINVAPGETPLQTSAWAVGAEKKLRNPPKKRTKKEELADKKARKTRKVGVKAKVKKEPAIKSEPVDSVE